MREFFRKEIEIFTGVLAAVNFFTLLLVVYLKGVNTPAFYICLVTFHVLVFLYLRKIFKSRKSLEKELKKAQDEALNLQDYITASWSANQKILHEEKILAVRFMMMGLSHEIGTPMGNALTSASVLKTIMDRSDIDDEELRYAVDLCQGSIQRTISIIDKLKDVAQITLKEEEQKFDLQEIFNNLRDVKTHQWKDKSIVIEVQCPEKVSVTSYPYSLTIFMGELIDNACLAYDGEPGHVDLICRRDHNDLIIQIIDKASGIKPEHMERIYDPFFTTQRNKDRLGLGIPVAHNMIVNLFHGELFIESQWEEGTEVSIRLPSVLSPVKVRI